MLRRKDKVLTAIFIACAGLGYCWRTVELDDAQRADDANRLSYVPPVPADSIVNLAQEGKLITALEHATGGAAQRQPQKPPTAQSPQPQTIPQGLAAPSTKSAATRACTQFDRFIGDSIAVGYRWGSGQKEQHKGDAVEGRAPKETWEYVQKIPARDLNGACVLLSGGGNAWQQLYEYDAEKGGYKPSGTSTQPGKNDIRQIDIYMPQILDYLKAAGANVTVAPLGPGTGEGYRGHMGFNHKLKFMAEQRGFVFTGELLESAYAAKDRIHMSVDGYRTAHGMALAVTATAYVNSGGKLTPRQP